MFYSRGGAFIAPRNCGLPSLRVHGHGWPLLCRPAVRVALRIDSCPGYQSTETTLARLSGLCSQVLCFAKGFVRRSSEPAFRWTGSGSADRSVEVMLEPGLVFWRASGAGTGRRVLAEKAEPRSVQQWRGSSGDRRPSCCYGVMLLPR